MLKWKNIYIYLQREIFIIVLNHFKFDRVSKYCHTRCEREFGWLQVASVIVSISPTFGLMPTWKL